MDSIKSQLMDMGFTEAKVKRAIESCPDAQTLEQVMEWLIAHEHELNANSESSSGLSSKVIEQPKPAAVAGEPTAKSNDKSNSECGANETAANMAARKKITVEEAQKIITERQAQRAVEERKKEIEDEKRRRMDGQKMAETRAELQDQERIRLAQQIRQEKLEKELHRKQVLDQIARDREAMRLKNNSKASSSPSSNNASSSTTSSSSVITKNQSSGAQATECKIALRFPDGSSIVQKFSPQEQLAAVRLFVKMQKNTSNDIEFIAPPNKKLTESMMNDTLENLGLCPASRLEVKYIHGTPDRWADLD